MGFFDKFASDTACPSCGNHGARQLLWIVKCRNRSCERFDPVLAADQDSAVYPPPARATRPAPPPPVLRGDFDPGPRGIEVRYTNHLGEYKTFVGDAGTLRRRGTFVSLCVTPTGQRISLRLDGIENRSEVESRIEQHPEPDGVERQILAYHTRRGSTSARYREVRAKFPEWQP